MKIAFRIFWTLMSILVLLAILFLAEDVVAPDTKKPPQAGRQVPADEEPSGKGLKIE